VIADEGFQGDWAESAPLTYPRYHDAGVLVCAGIYLYANLFVLPRTPFLLGGDQALFWMNAQRLLNGELIYRDFLEFTPPGTDLIYLGMFKLLGSRIWVPNLVVLLLGIVLCWLCFHTARMIMKPAQAAFTAALFLVVDYGRMLNGTHHWFSVLAVMAALAALLKARTPPRIVIAGALLGVASFFTQTRGPMAALGVGAYLIWDQFQTKDSWVTAFKRLLLLILPLIVTWGALSSYFIAKVGFAQLWYFQVTYVLRYVASGPTDLSIGSPEVLAWLRTRDGILFLLVYLAVPIVYAFCLWKCRRRGRARGIETNRIMLLTLVGAAMFAEVAQSPNWIRLYCVAMPAIILFVWLLTVGVTAAVRGYATTLTWVGLICLAAHQTWSRHHEQRVIEDLPAGRIATAPATGEKLAWLARHTTPGQLLFEARWVDLYLPLALRNPVFADMLEGGHNSRPEFIDLSIRQLEAKNVQFIIWSHRLESEAFPYAKFRSFLGDHYARILTFPDQDQVWERK
jgi:hypothetical protein